jgi:hypothetical protein
MSRILSYFTRFSLADFWAVRKLFIFEAASFRSASSRMLYLASMLVVSRHFTRRNFAARWILRSAKYRVIFSPAASMSPSSTIVAVEYRTRFVSADLHRNLVLNTGPLQVPHGRPTEVVKQEARHPGCFAGFVPPFHLRSY